METKTIKLSNAVDDTGEYLEYTNFYDDGTLEDHDVVIINGARGVGKSYPVAKFISKRLIDNPNAKFIYMRNRNNELATFEGWCKDLDLDEISGWCAYTKLKRGKPTRGDILLTGYTDEGDEIYSRVIGKCISLESSSEFKSGNYSEFTDIVFEEYVFINMREKDERHYVFNFLENVESIFRNRPKKIFCLCNNLKSLPLLERAIDELTGEENGARFKNPIKIKVFRKNKNKKENKTNAFLAYLEGELYEDEDFIVRQDEFYTIYVNKRFIIKKHKLYPRKHYIQQNKTGEKGFYRVDRYRDMLDILKWGPSNEYYFQNKAVEVEFTEGFKEFKEELEMFISQNVKYIDNSAVYY